MHYLRNFICIAATFLITSCKEEPPPPPPAPPVEKKVEKAKPSFSSSNALSNKNKKTQSRFGSKKEGLGGSTLKTGEGKDKVMLQGSK